MNLKIEYVPIDSIKPYAGNAKLHPQQQIEQIKKSIELMGFDDPIAVWKNNEIIEGHGRLLAAQQLGISEVPIIRLDDLTDEQRRAYALIHNKLTMNSGFDTEILNVELAHIGEIDMESFDFQIEPLDFDNLGSLEDGEESSIPSEVVEDDYEEELPEEPTAKHGDIFLLGRHRLMCGDSTKIEDVKRLVDGAEIDILVTDPPYNVEYEGKTKDRLTIKNDSMEDSAFRRFLRDAFSSADAVLKPGGVFYIWHADSEGYNFRGACKDIDWQVRQCLIWVKSVLVMGRQDYQWKHEPCLYGWKSGAGHFWASDRKQTTTLNFDKPVRSEIHPTMKPIALFDYLIKNSSKVGENVLDLFNGSGTTIMACEQNGRNAFCMELDPRYVDAAVNRWEQFTGKKAVLLNPEYST